MRPIEGGRSGAKAEIDDGNIRLSIWEPGVDEFVILSTAQARKLATQLVEKCDEIRRLSNDPAAGPGIHTGTLAP
jgi:hypothetical protein